MEDKKIIDLFFARNEDAIQHTADTYGNRLFVLADNIVRNDQDAEESVSDTYLKAWDTIPPQKPNYFFAYLAKICRHFALGKLDWKNAAKRKAEDFIGKDKIKETKNNGYVENGDIPVYRFEMTTNDNKTIGISISKKGGHVVALNYNREVTEEKISEQDAVQKGKKYLASKGFNNMQETYYLKENGFITVNYAYKQDDVVMYADLIKVKIALDDGEVIGLETTGYLNCHYDRTIPTNKISIADARKHLSDKAQVTSEGLAMIPTEWKTEKYCYEFKGKIEDIDFIAYIDAETGEEEDILIVTNTPNGTLTE